MSFGLFAKACGMIVDHPKTDGKIHRCGTTEHPRSKNGAYAFDGVRGWAMAWDAGGETQWYDDPNAQPWTEDEKRAWLARRDVERAEQHRKHAQAAQRADAVIRSCAQSTHGYLRLKGFPDLRALVADQYERFEQRADGSWSPVIQPDVLVVPMRNLRTNALQGLQAIYRRDDAWVKEMTPGMRAKGAVLRLGRQNAHECVLCEGWATGLSIEAAIKQMRIDASVLVCFSDSNMVFVAEALEGRFYTFADNDRSGAGERAAKAIGRPYCMAPTVGWDANDWHASEGLIPLCAALMKTRRDLEAAMP